MNQTVKHLLDIYATRLEMQEKDITNSSKQIKQFTKYFVEKLKSLPPDDEITMKDGSFYDKKMNLIIKIPYLR